MSEAAQNRQQLATPTVVRALSPWHWRPLWQGLIVAIIAISATVYGTRVNGQARATHETVSGLREGLELLSVQRDVSLIAHEALSAITMQMYEGGRKAEVDSTLGALEQSVRGARVRLESSPPRPSWRGTQNEMVTAADQLLDAFGRERSNGERLAWIDEFLYDFRRVVPTDNQGRWSALLEIAANAQNAPLVFRDYLEGSMAREWSRSGRAPADRDLIDEYRSHLTYHRRLRESQGDLANEFSPFEESILLDVAEQADPVSLEIVMRMANNRGVLQLESDVPYLLSLREDHAFRSMGELYESRALWASQVAQIANELLLHAQGELDVAVLASERVRGLGTAVVALALLFAMLFAFRIVRERLKLDAQLRTALERDVLTGLTNRYALFAKAPDLLSDPEAASYALILLDLDDFKSINDDHGHYVGDRALVEFATALNAVVRSDRDMVSRVGGDEFVVFLHGLKDPEREVTAVVRRLKQELEQPVSLEGVPTQLHFTAGVAVSKEAAKLEDLLVEADLALIEAKEQGRDSTHFFRRKLGRRMTAELSVALGNGRLRCAFQPQIDMETGRVVGLEALARWQREDRREVPARSVIEALEWQGSSKEWLRVAMRDIEAAWNISESALDGRLWINLMGSDVTDTASSDLLDILGGTRVPLDRLGVEVTDPVDRARIPAAVRLLTELRSAGIAVALDDVGDDRVPLLHVAELPIDVVKLDRCLVAGIDTHAELRTILTSLSEMCDRLGRTVIAEGVETVEEEAVLRRLGIRYVQGFRFSKPMTLPGLREFLEARFVGFSASDVA